MYFINAKNRKQAIKAAPNAAFIVKVEGGYLAFESVDEYYRWKRQK